MKKIILTKVLLGSCLAISGCQVKIPDAAYMEKQDYFTENRVADSAVIGKWVTYESSAYGYQATQIERRNDYEFTSRGGGRIREVTQFHATGNRIVIEAPIRWRRVSPWMWEVSVPSSDKYKVIEAKGAGISGARSAIKFQMRYSDGRLYNVNSLRTLVPIGQARKYIDEERGRIRRGEAMPFLIGVQ